MSCPTDAFENFVYGVLQELGPARGFRTVGQPKGTGDGGFDIDAVRIVDSKRVCVQCKRYKDSLSVADVALELAKVALTSAIEGSEVATRPDQR
jgi:HJR/Mrr/RecB family endonuclease